MPLPLFSVAVGGFFGTLLRFGVSAILDGEPLGTLTVNLLGAAVLGFLIGWAPWSRRARGGGSGAQAFLTTGLLGGFTTYSALALDVLSLPLGWAAGYAAATVIGGVSAAVGGILLGRRLYAVRPRPNESGDGP